MYCSTFRDCFIDLIMLCFIVAIIIVIKFIVLVHNLTWYICGLTRKFIFSIFRAIFDIRPHHKPLRYPKKKKIQNSLLARRRSTPLSH